MSDAGPFEKPNGSDADPATFAGRYQILSLLGTGGMGKIYKAYDLTLHRHVALKFVRTDDPELERRLLREAQAQARIDHDCVCKIFDLGQAEGKFYIAMQYVDGQPFDHASQFTLQQKVALIKHVADALHAAHSSGLIHRDIKPSNILLERTAGGELRPILLDFGLVRDTTQADQSRTGTVHGTPNYMSPEQALGEVHQVDGRSDLYSLGATFFELLVKRTPFQGTAGEVMLQVIEEDPPLLRKIDPALPEDLETIVMKCLEKDPGLRYESAKLLSEDLARFLDGEPISGKRTTWMYKSARKVRKYPLFSAVLGTALLLILVLIAFGLRARWTSQQQMKLANEFDQEVKYIEENLKYAYTAPLHDVRSQEAAVVTRLGEIQERIKQTGSIAQGPGNYALGKGYLSLRRFAEARKHLETAYQTYRVPQVAYALGLTIAMEYQSELQRAEAGLNKELRETRKKQIEKEYRDPALQYIREGQEATSESPEYAQAVVAFLEKRYDLALEKAAQSRKRFPWLYQASSLTGDAYASMANDRRDHGESEAGFRFYEKAEQAYGEAIRAAGSDAKLYERLCSLQQDVMTLQVYQTSVSPKAALEKAVVACENASRANPDSAEAFRGTGGAYVRWGEYQMASGVDPRPALEKAIVASARAVQIDPKMEMAYTSIGSAQELKAEFELGHGENPITSLNRSLAEYQKALRINRSSILAHDGIGLVYSVMGQYEMYSGLDPRPTLDRAIQSFQKTIQVNPNFAYSYSNVGTCYFANGQYEAASGLDPRHSFDLALQNLNQALKGNSENVGVLTNLASVWIERGVYELNHGLDPRASADQASKAVRKAIQINPQNAKAYNDLSSTCSLRGQYESKQGLDASVSLDQTIEYAGKAVELNPQFDVAHLNLASAYTDKAVYLLERGLEPDAVLASGRSAHRKAHEVNPAQPYGYWTHGVLEIVAARLAIRKGWDPTLSFQEANTNLQKALQLNPGYAEVFQSLAELAYWKAEWLLKRKPSSDIVTDGLAKADQALSINPQLAEAHAVRGLLLLLRARMTGDGVSARNGKSSLHKALEINPSLQKKYKTFLQQADILESQ